MALEILIVDDEKDIRDLVAGVLSDEGYGCRTAGDSRSALEAIDARAKLAESGYRGAIAIAMQRSGDMVRITVTDNGIGLPQDRDRIVEPYVTTREKGTGLGLAIVKKIVEEHGGEMSFVSAEGGGTQVTMNFARDPLAAAPGAEAAE